MQRMRKQQCSWNIFVHALNEKRTLQIKIILDVWINNNNIKKTNTIIVQLLSFNSVSLSIKRTKCP